MKISNWFIGVLAVVGLFAGEAHAATVFVNLSDDPADVAHYYYTPYSSKSGDLAVVTEAGWSFVGWWTIQPGEAFRAEPGNYYVQKNGNSITWNELSTSRGLIKRGSRISKFIRQNNQAAEFQKARNEGYTFVDYMKFPSGVYKISGDAYTIESKRFSFDYESRSIKFIIKPFEVPGRVVKYDVNASSRYAKDIDWKISGNKRSVILNGSIEGKQTSPFAARTPGVYSGSVTIYYTVRR